MVNFWKLMIQEDISRIDEVPSLWREQVRAELEKEGDK